VKELKAAGFTDEQAAAVTHVMCDARAVDLLRLATKAELAEAKAEILGWMVSSIGIQTVVIIGAVVALVCLVPHR
jgi:hypothetical protein